MIWSRSPRRPRRFVCQPSLEDLESRKLLSVGARAHLGRPVPAAASSPAALATTEPYDPLIGASATRVTYNVDGTGLTAAVIDTGVNYNNEALGGGFGPGHKVEAGLDLADGTSDPLATASQHGTAVAGLLASSDPKHPGVAPGADIVALRVFNQSGSGDFNTIADGLQWVIDHHAQYNISVVNLSVTDGANYSLDFFSNDGGIGQRIAGLVDQLAALDIPVVTAAGNSFSGQQGMGFPAILPNTISVTGTDTSDHLLSDAQRLGTQLGGNLATNLAAPGDATAPADGNSFTQVEGTSFAAPLVSGSIILLQQIYEQRFGQLPTVAQVKSWLQQGSDPVSDPATGITLDGLDVFKAAALVPGAPPPVSTPGSGGSPTAGSGNTTPTPGSGTGGAPTSSPPTGTQPPPTSKSTGSGDGSSGATTQLSVNGVSQGAVNSNSPSNPLQNYNAAFGVQGTFTDVQTWTAPNIPIQAGETQVFVNGQLQGTVPSDSAANPLAGFLSEFGIDGTFNTVQSWTSQRVDNTRHPATEAGVVGTKTVRIGHPAQAATHVHGSGHHVKGPSWQGAGARFGRGKPKG